jgi:hypothetical protein
MSKLRVVVSLSFVVVSLSLMANKSTPIDRKEKDSSVILTRFEERGRDSWVLYASVVSVRRWFWSCLRGETESYWEIRGCSRGKPRSAQRERGMCGYVWLYVVSRNTTIVMSCCGTTFGSDSFVMSCCGTTFGSDSFVMSCCGTTFGSDSFVMSCCGTTFSSVLCDVVFNPLR